MSYSFYSPDPATINKLSLADSVIRIQVGSSRSVMCQVSGFPKPTAIWISGDGKNPKTQPNNSAILDLLHVTHEDAGTYYCIANNVIINPPDLRREETDSWAITVVVEGEKIFIITNWYTCYQSINFHIDYDESGSG